MSILATDPDDVWVYLESGGQIMLPVELADDICAECRYLIPDTPALCCWWCTWDIGPEQEEQYRELLAEYEADVIAALDSSNRRDF